MFFNDKKIAEKNNYIMDSMNNSNSGTGSIICSNISVDNCESTFINAILSISTYGTKFIPNNNKTEVDKITNNIKNTLLPPYIRLLKIEMALLYIESLYREKCSKQIK